MKTSSKPAKFSFRRLGLLLPLLSLALMIAGLAPTAVSQSIWTHKGARARYGHSAVFDSDSGRLIVFAGQHTTNYGNLNDAFWGTYIAGSTELIWTPVSFGRLSPAPRFGHTAIYDSVHARMVVFGGGTNTPAPCHNDVWLLQNANGLDDEPVWSQQFPLGTAPAPRFAHTAVYDAGTNSMIVFGGFDCSSTYLHDVWVLNNANGLGGTPTWTQLSPPGTAPSGREGATAVYDQTNNLMIIFAGDSGSTVNSEVWVLSHANGSGGTPTWSQLFATGTAPDPRTGPSAIYDPASNRMTIYAGQTTPAVPVTKGGSAGLLNDFWVLTNANGLGDAPAWVRLTTPAAGAFRSFHSAAYDSSTNTMLIFGGKTTIALTPADDHITIVTQANGLQP